MTWRWILAVSATLYLLGCGETTVQPFVEKSDAGADAGEDDGGEDDDDLDGGEDEDEDLDGGEDDGGGE